MDILALNLFISENYYFLGAASAFLIISLFFIASWLFGWCKLFRDSKGWGTYCSLWNFVSFGHRSRWGFCCNKYWFVSWWIDRTGCVVCQRFLYCSTCSGQCCPAKGELFISFNVQYWNYISI